MLWCFSCSQHLDRTRFQEAVWTALLEAGREARVLAHLGQPMVGQWDPFGISLCLVIAVGGIVIGAWGVTRRDIV